MNQRVLPGAEAFNFEGGPIGVLLQHGFSGCPAAMRPMGQWLSDRGVAAVGPRLPGHGTRWEDLEHTTWQDWERESEAALLDLSARCPNVVVAGLSVGGTIVLHLGAKHPDKIHGVVVINGMIRRPDLDFARVARLFARSVKGVGNDIKRPGQDEICYSRIPLRATAELAKLLRTADRELPSMRLPLLVFSAAEDHTVKPSNSRRIMERAGSTRKVMIPLPNSYHVATLDYDAETIFERTLEFAQSVASNGDT